MDHVRYNNGVENLEWTTYRGNNLHANFFRKAIIHKDGRGNVIAEYDSISEAVIQTGVSASTIARECRGNHKGTFEFKNKDHILLNPNKTNKPVVQCDLLTGEKIFVWESAALASFYTNIDDVMIRHAIRGRCATACGYLWRKPTLYEAPQDPTKIDDLSKVQRKTQEHNRDGVVELYYDNNGLNTIMHKNKSMASKSTNIPITIVTRIANGERDGFQTPDGIVRWFIYSIEYQKRLDNGEELIQKVVPIDHGNPSIVLLSLEGDLVVECETASDAVQYLKKNSNRVSLVGRGHLIKAAIFGSKTIAGYRPVLLSDYVKNGPDFYKTNLPMNAIRKLNRLKTK